MCDRNIFIDGESAAVDFFPLDVSDFGSTIAKIQTVGPGEDLELTSSTTSN